MARNLAFELQDADFNAEVCTAPLIDKLLTLPCLEQDLLGHAIARCVDVGGAGDELLWRYIAGDIGEEDILKYPFDQKLRCIISET